MEEKEGHEKQEEYIIVYVFLNKKIIALSKLFHA